MDVRVESAPYASGDCEANRSGRQRGRVGSRRWCTMTRRWPAALCCVLYILLAMATYGNFGSLGPGHMAGTGSMDSIVQIWWLAWAAHTLPQIRNMFAGQGQNYPLGQNFGVNGSMLALGVIFTPITKLFGPVVTWNVLVRLALAASATSMCFVLRRWTTWWPAAFLGGLLYGFSAFMLSAGSLPLLFLTFAPLPPLAFLLLHEILVRQRWRPRRTGALLGLVCTLQFFISSEILAMTVVMGAMATALFLLIKRRTVVERWRYSLTAFAYSLGVGGLLLFYPLFFTFAGPQHIDGPPISSATLSDLFPVDLMSPIVTGWGQWIDPKGLAPVGQSFDYSQLVYLGLPLVVVLAFFAVFFRQRRMILFSGAMALIAYVLSLGPRLWIDGHETQIPLPFALIARLPALDGIQASRFALITDLFVAAMFAMGIDEMWRWLPGHLVRIFPRRSTVGAIVVVGALVVVVTLPLVPGSTPRTTPTDIPRFFTSAAVNSISLSSVVLAYPYPDQASADFANGLRAYDLLPIESVMLDQAVTAMRYKLVGGYGWFPSGTGQFGTISPAHLDPQSVQTLFDVSLGFETPTQRLVLSNRNLTRDLREFLRTFKVQSVVFPNGLPAIAPGGGLIYLRRPHLATLIRQMTAAIGPPVRTGGMTVWFHVQQRLADVQR